MELFCSNCRHEIDTNTGINTNCSPTPGSICICWYCGQASYFQEDLTTKKLTGEEMEELRMTEPLIYNLIMVVKERIKTKQIMN